MHLGKLSILDTIVQTEDEINEYEDPDSNLIISEETIGNEEVLRNPISDEEFMHFMDYLILQFPEWIQSNE
jgi:hypothetical protein